VRAGVSRLIVAGGDGTTSEVVSGLLAAGLGAEVELGLLPLGTGGDLVRTLAVPRDLDAAIAALASGERRLVDAGRISYLDHESKQRISYFLNVASFGISGLVDQLVNDAPKRLGGTLSFLIGTLRAFMRYRSQAVRICVDGVCLHDGPLMRAAAANGQFFGGGMHVAPEARLDSGELEVVVVPAMSKFSLFTKLPLLYRGSHGDNDQVILARGKCIEADAAPGAVLLDIDGEPLGTLPATIEVLPAAIQLLGVPASGAGA
jgi:YegS/Rv2252/BmrU family lipid kinase